MKEINLKVGFKIEARKVAETTWSLQEKGVHMVWDSECTEQYITTP